jgi:hypothetical protein
MDWDSLTASTRIQDHLRGFVKPYDVVALMSVLPGTRHLFPTPPGSPHRLLLTAEEMIDVRHVLTLLRECYHEVLLLTRAREKGRQRTPRDKEPHGQHSGQPAPGMLKLLLRRSTT